MIKNKIRLYFLVSKATVKSWSSSNTNSLALKSFCNLLYSLFAFSNSSKAVSNSSTVESGSSIILYSSSWVSFISIIWLASSLTHFYCDQFIWRKKL